MKRELFVEYGAKFSAVVYDFGLFALTKGKEFRVFLESEQGKKLKTNIHLLFLGVKNKITSNLKSTYNYLVDNKEDSESK